MAGSPSDPDRLSNPKARRLREYLRDELRRRDDDALFVKCKEIAQDIDLSSKEIGAMLPVLQSSDPDLQVEKWSWARATTWRIELAE